MSFDPHALPAGTVIAGYRIVRVLGAGGFGITYEGESPVTGRRVAIKEFFPRGIASRKGATEIIYAERDSELVSWALKRFESSTTEQCRLKHPNIVEVFHYIADNDTGYMFMDYVEGITLEQWLRDRDSKPTLDEVRPLLEPVFDALEYLHGMNFIHRDVAPDNIMVRPDGRPIIIDFGAIKVIEHRTLLQAKTVHSFMVGKQFYSPPEQTREGETLDARADIYALAAVLYRSFAGRPPADTEDRARKIAFGEGDSLAPLSELAPQIPAPIAAAIDRALSFRAADRQNSIVEFRDQIGWTNTTGSLAPTTPVIREVPRAAPAAPAQISASAAKAEREKKSGAMRWAAIAAVAVFAVIGAAFMFGMNPLRQAPQQQVAVVQAPETPNAKMEAPKSEPVAEAPKPEAPKPEAVTPAAPNNESAPSAQEQVAVAPEPKVEPKPEPKVEIPVAPPPPPVDYQELARRDFELAQRVDTRMAYEEFLSRHPDGFYSSLARAQLTKLAALEQKTVTRNVISELQRAGCGPANNDGEWDDAARRSLELFNKHAKTRIDVSAPNTDTLNALKEHDGRVCPLVCARGYRVQGDACVAIPQKRAPQPQVRRETPPQQQQAPAPQLPKGIICVRGICVGN